MPTKNFPPPSKSFAYGYKSLAWPLLALVWVMTIFLNDRTSTALVLSYVLVMGIAVIYGIYTAVQSKSWALGIFLWPH